MNCFLIISDREKAALYIDEYAKKNGVKKIYFNIYNDKIIVDTVRSIRKALSFKQNENKQIIILNNEITIEAQNALLKCIEELSEMTTIFIVSKPSETILPTIQSRCSVVKLNAKSDFTDKRIDINEGIFAAIESIDDGKTSPEEQLFQVNEFLRNILLDENANIKDRSSAYYSLKKILKLSPMVLNNNVQARIVIEKALLKSFIF